MAFLLISVSNCLPPLKKNIGRQYTQKTRQTGNLCPGSSQVLPEAVPLPPRLLVQGTLVTPTLSEAVPLRVMVSSSVEWAPREVGDVMPIAGSVSSYGVDSCYLDCISSE